MNSQWSNGALEVVRVAAYYPKRLSQKLVDQTNVPASVDTILQKKVWRVAQRVLGYLLLGVVRIYSKKVQYVCDNCEYLRVELNMFVGRERTNTSDEAMRAPFSITLPTTFRLDAFDLQISEERTSAHVRPSEKLVLKDAENHFLNKNYLLGYGSSSAICTPFEEGNERVESIEKFRRKSSFSLDEFLSSVIPGLVEQEPQRNDKEMNVINDETFVEVEEASAVPAHDENEASDTIEQIFEMLSPYTTQNDGATTTTDATPESKGPNSSGTSAPAFVETPVTDNVTSVGVQDLSAAVSYNEDQYTDMPEQVTLSQMVSSKDTINNQPSITIDATPQSKGPNASGTATSAFTPVQTPATRESCRVSRKRKRCLVDDIIILPGSLIKKNISDASDLLRERRAVPRNLFQVWKIQKLSNLAQNLFEPLIPYSSKVGSVFSTEKLMKIQVVEAPSAPEKMKRVIHLTPERILNIPEPPIINLSLDQADIAPSTPVPNPTSSKYFATVEDENDDYSETDIGLINEDIYSQEHSWEREKWSLRTRSAASCLCKNLSFKRKVKEAEVANLFQILEGKNKSESATMFYEVLVLKSGSYVDVVQRVPYDDIVITGTIKLKKFQDF